ncbi:WD repeat-containing protein 25 [Cynoglossus semilaevis]|uniref:WD repeat-containing protein 25 n=1 Tax=Cynoglossus semilaevis TaxID=244447 RepID=UPI000495A357|nr:WD repeat-containing protein 25 [Cynoglossus semilaevis]XP_016891064.1 WD repeat-containing protein 25 [Cynoglossus semilaevis]XP_024910095.1 WD repeat-containing protein 25 [Cynoglossus semilaevis]
MMSSLVAYDDSGSEDESLAHGPLDSVPTGSCREDSLDMDSRVTSKANSSTQNSDWTLLGNLGRNTGKSSVSVNYGQSQVPNCSDQKKIKCCYVAGVQNKQPGDTAAFLTQFSPHTPQRAADVLNPARRQHSVPSGVRPYVPKRQRLSASVETADPKCPAEQVPGSQREASQILSDVSERVKPYLDVKPEAAGLPRRLLLHLRAHQGPVNTVRWCPVPRLSHLLLSASMDKTFKVWDGAESGRCLRVYSCHSGAVRDACWTPCGRHLLTGSFDNTAAVTDVETGQQIVKLDNQSKVMCTVLHPSNPDIFLCGGYSPVVKAWDSRSCKVVKTYKASIQQTLDILFLRGGGDFITSSDSVSRDSADRTLIAWDFQTTARLSNQIYHERYTCPSLTLHPLEPCFVVQTNGNYMAAFSSQRPYRMNKRRQYKGHKVEGYAVRCEFSQDGTTLASGSSSGSAHFYDYHNTRLLHTLHAHSQPCLCVSQHPVIPATAATCDWTGEIKVWH